MPPHHQRRGGGGRRFRGPRYSGGSTIVEDVIFTEPDELDVLVVPDEVIRRRRRLRTVGDLNEVPPDDVYVPKEQQAGDMLPTLPANVRSALDQENANWQSLYDAVIGSLASGKVGTDFSFPFTNDLFAWKTFYTLSLQNTPVGWEPMAQLDGWRTKRAQWAKELQARIGAKLPGALDEAAPRESGAPSAFDITKLVLAVSAVAALVILGPALAKHF